jgi:hypothetical protein
VRLLCPIGLNPAPSHQPTPVLAIRRRSPGRPPADPPTSHAIFLPLSGYTELTVARHESMQGLPFNQPSLMTDI